LKEKDLSFKAFLKDIVKITIKAVVSLNDFLEGIEDIEDRALVETCLWFTFGFLAGILTLPLLGPLGLLTIVSLGIFLGLLRFAYWMWVDANS